METNVRNSIHEFCFCFLLFHKMLIKTIAATIHLLVSASSEIALLASTIACLVDTTTSSRDKVQRGKITYSKAHA